MTLDFIEEELIKWKKYRENNEIIDVYDKNKYFNKNGEKQ